MNEPISFISQTPRFGLPFLYSGQAQKEFFINEAHALIDSLLHPVVEGVSDMPPNDPQSGECWIVGNEAEGAWKDHADEIACFQSGKWLFAKPSPAMRVFDRGSGSYVVYHDQWEKPDTVSLPQDGETVDIEARSTIVALIETLVRYGFLNKAVTE